MQTGTYSSSETSMKDFWDPKTGQAFMLFELKLSFLQYFSLFVDEI
jgi:hypothetical protein